jgi:hypothetical protein
MKIKNMTKKIFLVLCLLMLCCMIGCAKQSLQLSSIKQANPGEGQTVTPFKESSYTVYMLLDLITVSETNVVDVIQKANPENKPVRNLKITSQADPLAAFVNILNGGVIDRGVIVSLNKVTVEGEIVE